MKLRVNIYLAIAMLCPVIMIALSLYPSWSQYAKSSYEYLLDATLISIAMVFLEFSLLKFRYLREGFGVDYAIALGFFGILLTDVTQPALQYPHYIVTGASACLVAYRMWREYRGVQGQQLMHIANTIAGALGLVLFLVSFFTGWYSTAIGEWSFAVIAAVHMYALNNSLNA